MKSISSSIRLHLSRIACLCSILAILIYTNSIKFGVHTAPLRDIPMYRSVSDGFDQCNGTIAVAGAYNGSTGPPPINHRSDSALPCPSELPVRPRGGNTLPNFLLHGQSEGLNWRDYHDGVVVFLHQNKAAGHTIKAGMRSMVEGGVLKSPEHYKIMTHDVLSTATVAQLQRYEAFSGSHSFGVCEVFEGKNCSYFTFLRDPFDRVLSAYYHCKLKRSRDQLCGPIHVSNFNIKEWAIYQGNYFFYQLLMDRQYCMNNPRIRKLFRKDPGRDFLPRNAGKNIRYDKTYQCWFKQRVYFSSVLNQTERDCLIDEILGNLESWFSVVGLTEEFDLSLRMLEVTYNLPFSEHCHGTVLNEQLKAPAKHSTKRERLRRMLESDPRVREALKFDIMIYEEGRRIFERQKEKLSEFISSSSGR